MCTSFRHITSTSRTSAIPASPARIRSRAAISKYSGISEIRRASNTPSNIM
nr:MAG TPA: hypothetical protein [Caudoviricetes sp.]